MTKVKKKKKIKLNNLLVLLCIISSLYLIYRIYQFGPIEPAIRYIIIGIILLIDFIFFYKKQKIKGKKLILFVMVIYIGFNVFMSLVIGKVYDAIDSINKSKVIYSTSLVTLSSNDNNDIGNINNCKIGIINDTLSIDNYVIANDIIKENKLDSNNEIKKYDDILDMLSDLYSEKIDYMFISSNYQVMFSTTDGYENIGNELKVITTKDKSVAKNNSSNNSSVDGPFSILLMGVDSEKDGLKKNAYANGDSLILVTFNPDTYNATMMSIPRDSYLPITCRNNKKNKLTHAGWYGTDCMIETIEKTFNIDIDYYVKVNFKGVVNLVDALNGVEVEVPKRLCTDNSDRMGNICIEKGLQTLDGEHALVLARNRYDLALGDIGRGYNQQLLIRAMIKKLTTVRSVNQLLDIIDTVSNNLDTNLTTNEILSFYNIFKDMIKINRNDDGDVFNIEQLKLEGTGKMVYFSNLKMKLWTYQLDKKSIDEVSKAMRVNLDLRDPDYIKEFHFKP